jgi:hypothetical protein
LGSAAGALVLTALLVVAGQRMEQAGPRRLAGIVALGILEILGGLARVGNQDLSGLVIAALAIALLVLTTRRSTRDYFRSR